MVIMSSVDDIKHERGTSIIVHTQLDIRLLSFVAVSEGAILPVNVQHIDKADAEKIIKEVR